VKQDSLKLQQVVQTGGHNATQGLLDFNILLESVYPHKMFTEFLKEERSDLFPYLIIIRKVKLLRAKQSDLELLQQQQQ
jgi:hypothetical protein